MIITIIWLALVTALLGLMEYSSLPPYRGFIAVVVFIAPAISVGRYFVKLRSRTPSTHENLRLSALFALLVVAVALVVLAWYSVVVGKSIFTPFVDMARYGFIWIIPAVTVGLFVLNIMCLWAGSAFQKGRQDWISQKH